MPVEVEGIRGQRYVVTDEVPILDAAAAEVAAEGRSTAGDRPAERRGGVAFLAPLDPLAWDRDLLLRLWDFDYKWEVYVPAPKRRWGYYVLPMLFGDRFVGRIELRHDRRPGRCVSSACGGSRASTRRTSATRASRTRSPRRSAPTSPSPGLQRVTMPRTAAHRALAAATRDRLAPVTRAGGRAAATP